MPLALSFAVVLVAYWCVDIAAPAIAVIRDDLTLSATGAGLIYALFFGGRMLGNFPATWLADRVGPSVTALIGGGLLLAGSFGAWQAGSAMVLLPFRALQGFGVALLIIGGLLSFVRLRPGQGAAMSLLYTSAMIGGIGGLLSGGQLTERYGWRSLFLFSVGLAALSMVVAAGGFFGRGRTASSGSGSALSAAPVSLRRAGTAFLANVFIFSNYSVVMVILPLYATERFNADAERVSLYLLGVTVVHLVGAFPAAWLVRRVGATGALITGFLVTGVGIGAIYAMPSEAWLVGPVLLYGLGQVIGITATGELILSRGDRGSKAVRLVRLSSDAGSMLGPWMIGMLADAVGYRVPFAVIAALTAAIAAMYGFGAVRAKQAA